MSLALMAAAICDRALQLDANGNVLAEAEPDYAQCQITSIFKACVTCIKDKCQVQTQPGPAHFDTSPAMLYRRFCRLPRMCLLG